jgi:monoamine oxidase
MRSILESPVGNILYFGGEACSIAYFSTAHGAYLSGASAAEALLEDHPELARMR